MKSSLKNISTIIRLFGYEPAEPGWYISAGSPIVQYPEESFRADFYVYGICIAGKASILVNNEILELSPRFFFTAIPSTVLQIKSHSGDFKVRLLVFERAFLLRHILDANQIEHFGFFSYRSLASTRLSQPEASQLFRLLDGISTRKEQSGIFHAQIMQSLIIHLLLETAEIYARHRPDFRPQKLSREEELFTRFMKLAQAGFREQHPVSYYCAKLFISPRYLIQICHDLAGQTPRAILAGFLIQEAKLLLEKPGNNVGMVSQALNYASTAAFSKFFRKETGQSPLQWKSQQGR